MTLNYRKERDMTDKTEVVIPYRIGGDVTVGVEINPYRLRLPTYSLGP